ncbi:alpha/beta hydrolase [Balneolaceae bacterium YR4-1]|uniref:Alpha/beta hydrolase n=1 Tax=Halalkalibaculum roseum TaxID=2709311 RepID=A0A6M1SLN2_9BACT|nr:alpha/beta hydrolase [Halalkalibaculum roseum]NGP76241.1 alpha/beta hydrolase [Halalkalibaculum roseum]
MREAEIVAFHGWGFDSSFWAGWEDLLPENIEFTVFERGYIGKPKSTPVFTGSERKNVILTHSFGLHLCPDDLYRQADLVVICSGFIDFHPVAAQYRRRSKLIIKQMLNALQGHPEQVLKEFYTNTYKPDEPRKLPEGTPNLDLLVEDLERLNTQTFEVSLLKSVDNICILHGFEDAIVHRRKGRSLYDTYSKQAKYFEVKDAGHALPYTHNQQCWQFIEPEIQNLTS